MPTTSSGVLAWAYSSVGVNDPSDPDSDFQEHTDCESSFSRAVALDLTNVQSASSEWTTQMRMPLQLTTRITLRARVVEVELPLRAQRLLLRRPHRPLHPRLRCVLTARSQSLDP